MKRGFGWDFGARGFDDAIWMFYVGCVLTGDKSAMILKTLIVVSVCTAKPEKPLTSPPFCFIVKSVLGEKAVFSLRKKTLELGLVL